MVLTELKGSKIIYNDNNLPLNEFAQSNLISNLALTFIYLKKETGSKK